LVKASGLEERDIQKMIADEFGKGHDGRITFEEFVKILGPLLHDQVVVG